MRGRLSKAMQLRHPAAPVTVQWHSGAALPVGFGLLQAGLCLLLHITSASCLLLRNIPASAEQLCQCAVFGSLPNAGVLLPRGVRLTNGSWSPRHDW